MRILLVSSNSSGSGGGELFFLKLAKHFVTRGEYVTIAYSRDSQFDGLANQALEIGCDVIRFPYRRIYDRKLRSLGLFLERNIGGVPGIDVDGYDVVHVSQQNVEDGIDLVAALGRVCPERLIVTIHIVEHLQHLGQRLGWLRQLYAGCVYRALRNHVRFAFVSSSAQQLFSVIFGVQPRYARVILNGAEEPMVSRTPEMGRDALGVQPNGLVVGSLGRLEEQKNYKVLIRAFAAAKSSTSNLRLLLVGDGTQRSELLALAEKLAVGDSVTITGWVDDPSRFLNMMDVFVLPSWFEGFPFALVEALMAERICLASSIAPHLECLSGETSLLFDPANHINLADSLKRVAQRDTDILIAAANAIKNAHSKFSMDLMIDQMMAFYWLPIQQH